MQELLIFPYSGTAIEALDCLGDEWNCIGFISDDENVIGKEFFNIKVYSRKALENFSHARVLAVHGSPTSYIKREAILDSLNIDTNRFATVVHKNASVSFAAVVGYNVLIMAGVVITASAQIGNHVIILPNSVIHHDSKIEDFTLIAANVTIAGNVRIGRNCYIGAASSFKNGVAIGNKVLAGIGTNVINSFSDGLWLIGNPAKPIDQKTNF